MTAGDEQPVGGPPVFVGGLNRSGTTLMARMLGSHSALAVPPTEFLFFGKGAAVEPGDRDEFERRLIEILRWPRVLEWGLDEHEVVERSRDWPASARSLFFLPLDAHRRRTGKARIAEKSVLNEFRLDLIGDWLRDYRMVQMIRDPVAAYASGHGGKPRSVRQAIHWAHLWAASAAIGLEGPRADPMRHRLVRYEDLTADPRATIATVCDFVGAMPEEDEMLRLAAYEVKDNSSFAGSSAGSYEGAVRRSDEVDRRAAISSGEVAALATICGAGADALGYGAPGRRSILITAALAVERTRPRHRLRVLLGRQR